MSRDVLDALRYLAAPTLAVVAVALFVPGHANLAVRVYALIVCGTALVVALVALRRAFPAEKPVQAARPPATRRRPPASLGRIEHEAVLGAAGSFDLHYRLAPRLRAIATGVLAARRGIALDSEPETARDALGATTWELVRPDLPAPTDRLARGIDPRELTRVVEALESV